MIEVYKLMTGKEQISPGQFFTPAAREWSTVGTDYQQKMLTRNLSKHSRTPTTAYAATIWTYKADQLASLSTYNYK